MGSSAQSLEDKIVELEQKIEALTSRCNHLHWCVSILSLSKISDPRYPYWNWELLRMESEDRRMRVSATLSALNARITGMGTPEEGQKDIDDVPRELLYASGRPTVAEVFQALKLVTGMKYDRQVVEMLRAVSEQGFFRPLCEYALATDEQ